MAKNEQDTDKETTNILESPSAKSRVIDYDLSEEDERAFAAAWKQVAAQESEPADKPIEDNPGHSDESSAANR